MEQMKPQTMAKVGAGATVEVLEAIGDAFNRHDLDGIMAHFAEDGVFDKPAGSEINGQRVSGKAAVRAEFAALFEAIPDIHWEGIDNWASGDKGCSEWHRTGTTTAGERQDWLGLDLFTFREGLVIKKDS